MDSALAASATSFGVPPPALAPGPARRILFNGCPLCGGRNSAALKLADCSHHPLFHPVVAPVMTWMQCKDCAHVYTDGYFSPAVLDVIFARTHEHQKPGAAFEQQRPVSARMVECVARYIKDGPWLDVGFGNGSLLFTAQEWGFSPVGLDLRPSSVDVMRQLGIEAHCIDIAAFDQSERFSVVSMADVLEHMPFPKTGLSAARRLLRPDGILFVSMPSYDCAAWRLLDTANANPFWGELEHFHNFSRTRLYTLMQEMGFEPIHYGVSERYRVCMEVIARRT